MPITYLLLGMDTKERISSDHFFIVWKFEKIYCLSFRNATYNGTNIGKATKQYKLISFRAEN
jgi:hypothetical protein